ncbi:augmin complex subunit dgt5 isoform X2 [Drosophila grimshawi]|uniref:GH19917 n=1 Tax=Drosophila grimshawi TaxID=7222 RepID=B4J8V5_DROGR|nr:augmin complex subunit dgt5 isoform X2 [Drosophila grimshawi]EDW02395.1 GH19917 [Drosophila grimshawi]
MAFGGQIDEFRAWATGLCCSPSDLPNEDALKSIFKSRQLPLFVQLQSRLHPRQHVQEVRENLLIAQVTLHKDKVLAVCQRSFLPRPMQIHLKMLELKKEKEQAELGLSEAKKEFDNLAATIKSKNIQIISAKHKKQLHQSRTHVLQLKLDSLNKTYEQELENKAQILAAKPVSLNRKNFSEKLAMEQAQKELENFYNICNAEGNNTHQLAEAKQRLWSQMRQTFANTPNVLLFNAILKTKEEQLQHVMQLNKRTPTLDATNSVALSKPPMSAFEVKLLKTRGDLLGLVSKYVSARDEVSQQEERFASIYDSFVDDLLKSVGNFNYNNCTDADDSNNIEEIVSDFMMQYNKHNFNQARNDFLAEQIEQLRVEQEAGAKHLEQHELLLGSIKQMYSEINTSVNRIQHDMLQLSQIKEKILYSKNMLKNMLDEMQATSQHQNAKSHLRSTKLKVGNMSFLGMESFNPANDSVLSSTKLDIDPSLNDTVMRRSFDNTTLMPSGLNSTAVMSTGTGYTHPCHLMELNTFAEVSFEKFYCMPRECAFLLSANPLIVESQELASTMQLAPGYLLTPHGALQEVRKRILWASAIAAHTTDLKLNLEPLIVDPHDLKLKARRQHEEIIQILHNIEALGTKTQHQLQRLKRIFRFITENPLRKYVPPTKLFNNANFAVYESEFNLYYRIATAGGSIKA